MATSRSDQLDNALEGAGPVLAFLLVAFIVDDFISELTPKSLVKHAACALTSLFG